MCTITNTAPADPKLTLVKSSTTTQLTQVGQQVPYSFLVTNTGNVTVTDLSVADTQLAPAVQANMSAVSCPSTTLAAGQSVTCTGTYTVTQADLDNGELKDSATATGETPSGPVTTPPSAVTIPGNSSPSISIVKSANPTVVAAAGDTVAYSFVVKNTGNVTLHDVAVDDTFTAPAGPALAISCPKTVLAPDESETCTASYSVTQADVDAGSILNSATSTGTPPTGPPVVSPPSTAVVNTPSPEPSISIVKSANPTVVAAAGDTVAYSFVVKNTGNVTLHDVAVDDTFTVPAGPALAISCPKTVLAPDESETCTASYSVTQADVDAGSILNSATSTGTPPTGPPVVSPPSTAVVTANPSTGLSLVKSAVLSTDANGDGKAGVGDEISYSFLVTNTGAVTLHGVTVVDQLVAPAGPALTVTCPAGDLAPGADLTCTASPYVVTQADVDAGSVANSATATGVPPTGPPVVSPPSDTTTPTPSNPGIRLTKVAYLDDRDGDGKAGVGELISYEFTVENTGSVTLTNVHVDDPMLAQRHLTITCPGDSLGPGDVMVCVSSDYTVTQAEVDAGVVANVATATGVPPHGDPVGSPPSKADVPTTTAPPTEEHPASSLAFTGSNVFGAVTLGGLLLLAGLALTLVTSRRRTDA
ncbi:hypothetical protein GCM10009845_22550 [Pedococcus bigeumensis]